MKITLCLNYILALLFTQPKLKKEKKEIFALPTKCSSTIEFKLFSSDIIIFLSYLYECPNTLFQRKYM